MRHIGSLLLLAALGACAAPAPSGPQMAEWPEQGSTSPVVCRIGPNGGPVLTERGIGGTGSPVTKLADRGIGGTGIVGVITGFASVCVDGLEVRYNAKAAVDIDGKPARPSDLRVGEVVAIQAAGPTATPVATAISVRRDLVGRIEAVALDSGIVTVAGQPVIIQASTEGGDFGLGDWVSVSGLRRPDGVLVASRLDSAPAGHLLARGEISMANGVAKLGRLVLPPEAGIGFKAGQYVSVKGEYVGGHGQVSSIAADPLPADPGGYFGPSISHLVVQGYLHITHGSARLNGMELGAKSGLRREQAREGLVVVSLERRPDGTLAVTGLRYSGGRTQHKRVTSTAGAQVPPPPPLSSLHSVPGNNAPTMGGSSGSSATPETGGATMPPGASTGQPAVSTTAAASMVTTSAPTNANVPAAASGTGGTSAITNALSTMSASGAGASGAGASGAGATSLGATAPAVTITTPSVGAPVSPGSGGTAPSPAAAGTALSPAPGGPSLAPAPGGSLLAPAPGGTALSPAPGGPSTSPATPGPAGGSPNGPSAPAGTSGPGGGSQPTTPAEAGALVASSAGPSLQSAMNPRLQSGPTNKAKRPSSGPSIRQLTKAMPSAPASIILATGASVTMTKSKTGPAGASHSK